MGLSNIFMRMLLLMTIIFSGLFAWQGIVQGELAAAAIGSLGMAVFLAFAGMWSKS